MRRGDVYWVNLEPVTGSEANKTRPAVIVSNDALNRTTERLRQGVVTVAPLTSNIRRVRSFQVLVPAGAAGLPRDSKVQADQVRTISAHRLGERVGTLPPALLAEVDAALRLHLNL
ncbi:type II toxin-antitoxin system PemK/MazF family toxin [Jiangella asiatica]|uniref:mRNA interferase n=1 Tax=Jiangella asiatica TaxID=2530372 RepID=A0A4R5D9V8_9ACTN|nr:type II toxin-antitoxin system PemK/MazF family toxin [Jiangella asiatica]TDE10359.1 type II toxin-antitoxin system PemK/MazF family toxin [Jiangella asiatica]